MTKASEPIIGDAACPSGPPLSASLASDLQSVGQPAGSAARVAKLVAEALGLPAGLVDLGADGDPVVYSDGSLSAATVASAWRAVGRREPRLRLAAADGFTATAIGFEVMLEGKPAWIAGIDPEDRDTPPGIAAIRTLIGELDAQWRCQRATVAQWVQRLEHENRQMVRAQRLIGVGTLTYDFAEDAVEASSSALEVFGGQRMASLDDLVMAFDPFDRPFVHRTLNGRETGGDRFDFEREVQHPDGLRRWVRINGELMRTGERARYIFATVQDVTAGRETMGKIQSLAERDPLTGAYNRTIFSRATREAISRAEEERLYAALFIVDIDNFKDINDTFGHPAGDEILRFVARVLTSLTRASDTVLRLAGDEFAVIVSRAANTDGIMALAERILTTLRTDVTVGTDEIALSTSIGVAIFPDDVSPKVDIYRACDHALFEAKGAGRGIVRRFDPRMREEKEERRAFIGAVREAIGNGEFISYFQPKLDLKSGTVVGFEALCRWHHPRRGTLGPADFGAAFDDRDVGGPLSDISLAGGFRAAGEFRRRGLEFGHIAINLNRAQLERSSLLADVDALAREHHVPASEIVFEVLENVLIREQRAVYDNLTGLFQAGYCVALDDFGTGFASLTHIREPFIREVKIDRSFVSNSRASPDDHQIVAAIVQMAHKMGLTMVAEGIEDEETLRQLMALGCTVGQGFVFAKALPFEDAVEFVIRRSQMSRLETTGSA